jgi:hypothetical protein
MERVVCIRVDEVEVFENPVVEIAGGKLRKKLPVA